MNPDFPKTAEQPTTDDNESADKMMSREEIRRTENRLMSLGLGPENFTENEGFGLFDERKEALALQKRVGELNDVDLEVLAELLISYQEYLSSQSGRMAVFKGTTPDVIEDRAGNFGGTKRMDFLMKTVVEEEKRRKIGSWRKLLSLSEVNARYKAIGERIVSDRDDRNNREAREALKKGTIQTILGHAKAFREQEEREEKGE